MYCNYVVGIWFKEGRWGLEIMCVSVNMLSLSLK